MATDAQSSGRRCVFCDSDKDLEREHVWPEWLQRMDWVPERVRQHHVTERDDEQLADRRWESPPFSVRVRRVCHDCNHGWMSDLEQAAKPLLVPMIEGRGRALHRDGQRTVATWAVKTAMMFEFTHTEILVVPQEHHHHVARHREPPPQSIVSLAAYDAGRFDAYYRQHPLRVAGTGAGAVDAEGHNGYVATLGISHLVLQVFGHTVPVELAVERADWIAGSVYDVWPYGDSLTWMPRPALTAKGLAVFADSILTRG